LARGDIMIPTGLEFWISFILIGIIANVCSSILLHAVKQFKAFGFNREDVLMFINFCDTNREYIENYVTKNQKFLYRVLYFLPYYTCYVNIVNVYFCLKHDGAKGIVIGKIKSEQFRFFPLINFNLNYK
jgi:hypothetical protein